MKSTSKSLVIVESPAKARTIRKFLGDNYEIEASIGHVRDLPQGTKEIPEKYRGEDWAYLGVDVDHDFEPVYVVSKEKKKQVDKLKSLLKEADHGAVGMLVFLSCVHYGLRLRESVAVADDGLQGGDCLVDDPIPLGIHLVQKLLILLGDRNHIGAVDHHDPVIDPLAVIPAEFGKTVHAEPEQTVVGVLKGLLTFEFRVQTVTAGHFLEGLQLVHRKETHIGTASQPGAVDSAGTEPCLYFFQIDADVVTLPQQPLYQTFQLRFAGVAVTHQEERFLHSPAFDIGYTSSDEFQEQLLQLRISVGEGVKVTVKDWSRCIVADPVTGNLDG